MMQKNHKRCEILERDAKLTQSWSNFKLKLVYKFKPIKYTKAKPTSVNAHKIHNNPQNKGNSKKNSSSFYNKLSLKKEKKGILKDFPLV